MKSLMHRLDPELAEPLRSLMALMGESPDLKDIPAARARSARMLAAMKPQIPVVAGVTAEDRRIPDPGGSHAVPVRLYRPEQQNDRLPALLWIHGGGYVLGSLEIDDYVSRHLAKTARCMVVSVDYRLAPEHPFPAPLEDCYTALRWLAEHARDFGGDPDRIAVGGASAGGGLAAGLALLARDRAQVDLIFQLLIYPMLDDRNTQPAGEVLPDSLLWTRENNRIGWSAYLGFEPGGKDVPPYASVLRADDLSGLPAAYIAVGELDLFLDEDIAYARRLLTAGGGAELHVYQGAIHAFDGLAPQATVSRRFTADRDLALTHALHR